MRYVATGCDSAFVELTCGMLGSLEEKGGVDDARIIVTAFGLTPDEKARMRLAAGVLGRSMRFLDVDRGSALIPTVPRFSFPLPMLGCLIAPKGVTEPGSRILILDSDIIINDSLVPLFELNLADHPVAAVKDMLVPSELHWRGRQWDETYFNTGVLLADVDRWNALDLGNRAMRWLAELPEKPHWPDQDALNAVVGADWLRLDRTWNFAYSGEERWFTAEEFGAAKIVHFPGVKPTEHRSHPAAPLYDRQIERLAAKARWGRPDAVGNTRDFIATTYEILLGREVEEPLLAFHRSASPASAVVRALIQSNEFREKAVKPLRCGERLAPNRWPGTPSVRQRLVAADRLPIASYTSAAVEKAPTWRSLLLALMQDEGFMAIAGEAPLAPAP
jgi:hypothetical protein